jgi:capsular polysaccharide export protein
LEQGYFRPDWVTLERDGVNAQSKLPRQPEWYRRHPAAAWPETAQSVGLSTPSAVLHISLYHFIVFLSAFAFPRFRSGYEKPAPLQAIGHVCRFVHQLQRRGEERRISEMALNAAGPKFLLLLQRPGDSQLWRHSGYRRVTDLIDKVCENFAAHAPEGASLLIRPHPLDPGLTPYRRHLRALARRTGLVDRLHFSDCGKLHDLLPHLAGVVCVNSTGGLAGIEFGVPTITLGAAHYNMPGLTHQGDLDGFWRDPQKPDTDLYTAFRRVVLALTQVNGGYAPPRGRKLAIPKIVERITSDDDELAWAPIGGAYYFAGPVAKV